MRRTLRVSLAYATILAICYYLYSITEEDEEIRTNLHVDELKNDSHEIKNNSMSIKEPKWHNLASPSSVKLDFRSKEREFSPLVNQEPSHILPRIPNPSVSLLKIHGNSEMTISNQTPRQTLKKRDKINESQSLGAKKKSDKPIDITQFETCHVPRNRTPKIIGDRAPRSASFLNGY